LGHKTSTHYFSYSGGTNAASNKARRDTLHRTCVFATDEICGSGSAFRHVRGAKHRRTIFHARVAWCGFQKSVPGHDTPNMCFCFWWDLWVTQCIAVHPGHEISMHYFSCRGGPEAVSKKARRDTLRQRCVFIASGICGSHRAFQCIQGAKHRRTIFQTRVVPVQFHEKSVPGHVTLNLCFCIRWDLRVT
jgi:hypothetical protein